MEGRAPPPPQPSKYRILDVTLVSAQRLKPSEQSWKTYAKLWIRPGDELRTEVKRSGKGADDVTLEERFVFAAPDDFVRDETSAVFVEVFRVRGGWRRDELRGRASCPVGAALEGGAATSTRGYLMNKGGVVKVRMAVADVKGVGAGGFMNWAMRYGAFMGEEAPEKKKKKRWLLTCVSPA